MKTRRTANEETENTDHLYAVPVCPVRPVRGPGQRAVLTELLARKTKLEREGGADPVYDGRVQAITGVLERTDSAITGFDDGIVFQMISRVTVLDKERLCVRFKDGTEIEQTVEHMERRDTA